ncbi:MAG TPA: glucoamylase family protein [Gemmatimonadaceae bacterium]|nr:glucoamylase family protein [Gemmatimonadaceae bacterium]
MLARLVDRLRRPREELVGPIRGEVLGADRLAERARTIGREHRLQPPRRQRGPGPLLERLESTRSILERAYRALSEGAENGLDISPAGEWFLDNFYIIQEHMREVRATLPGSYYQELPKLASGPLVDHPRVYEVAIELIAHTEGHLDLENISLFTREYQRIAPLKLGELWAVPAMLRLGLVENIRRMALRLKARLKEVELADNWARRLHEAHAAPAPALSNALSDFVDNHPTLSPTFVARFLQQLRSYQANFTPLVWLEQWISEDGPSTEEAVARSNRRVALTQITVVNSIMSLRTLSRLDWKVFVEEQSAIERVLRQDPSGHYDEMTFETRDLYRRVVEGIAKRSAKSEEEVAALALALARTSTGREGHIGFWLVDDGRLRLEREARFRPGVRARLHRAALRHPNTVYFGGVVTTTAAGLGVLSTVLSPATPAQLLLLLALALVPVNEIAINLMNQLLTILLPPRSLPRLEFREEGIPEEFRTVVVVPTLFPTVRAVREALEHIEVQYLANRDPNLHFAVLSDFTDASAPEMPADGEILDAGVAGVRELNQKYATDGPDVFFLFHRPRQWNEQQAVWMGWERKRGKLAQFNQFVRGGARSAFSTIEGDASILAGVKYVITLDSDTLLPRDTAQLLVGTMAHPLNRPVYDRRLGLVMRGYGILQPRVGVSLTSAHRSRFASIHSGHPGVDPYTTAVSDVYQDLWGEGSFAGKGIYDVDAFERATHGRFPENTLLSHDLIEGTYCRAALVTDLQLFDDYPTRYLAFTRRKHRWIRGDWQLLRWLRETVPGPDGPTNNRLSLISRWKIFDNLRRSVVEIALLLMLVGGWIWLDVPAIRWTVAVLAVIAFPWLLATLLAALRPPADQSWRAYYAAIIRDVRLNVQQYLLALTFLPHQAVISADAIVRTLVRLGITERNLLEWQTASQVERDYAAVGPRAHLEIWRRMWPAPAVALAVGSYFLLQWQGITELRLPEMSAAFAASVPALIAVFAPCLLWLISPSIAYALSAPAVPPEVQLTAGEKQALYRYARLHWHYFDRFVSDDTHWLAPDNFQEDPQPVVALRTSPTNIGLQILSVVSAEDLGFIDRAEMIERLEKIFRTLELLRRYRGHFFNWYDLSTLEVMEPAYISSVDSGNLAGSLIAFKQACDELAAPADVSSEESERLRALSARAHEYVQEMDFRFLFDDRRKLFSIGFQHGTATLDNSYYDLLASEARITSFIAIAKDEVDPEHWFRLGRSIATTLRTQTLLSWSGSMFEYLMPLLVMRSFPFTLLDQTYHGAVRRHISYGTERGVPWGISESAYNMRDRVQNYQYKGFGVPDLALKRGLRSDLVIAPYATMLALLVEPHQAVRNLAVLEGEGALGPYGFRDAIDYTRPAQDTRRALVRTYMAHHIGMSMVAITNALRRQIWQKRFHTDPLVRSAELMLHERIPRRLIAQAPAPDDAVTMRTPREKEKPAARELDTPHTAQPRTVILGTPPYTVLVSNAGGGYDRYGNFAVTRWRPDGVEDSWGQWCYVRDVATGAVWSTTYQPTATEPSLYRTLFATDRAVFLRRDGDVETQMEIAVVPDDAAAVRRVTLINRSSTARDIELTSYSEVVLAPPETDRAHPAFGNLFVETEWLAGSRAILASRRPRSTEEKTVWCAHVVAVGHETTGEASFETNRTRFIGRGRSTRSPRAMDPGVKLSGTTGAVLDPIFAIRVSVTIPPGRTARVAFTTIVAEERDRALELADLYHDPYSAKRALDLCWAQGQAELRDLGITPSDAALYQQLAGNILYPHPALDTGTKPDVAHPQDLLWGQGISGDFPIVLGTIATRQGMPSVRQLLQAHHYWRTKGIATDLVILNTHPASYLQELHDELLTTAMASSEAAMLDRPGGVFIRRADLISHEERSLIEALARLHLECDGLGLGNMVESADLEPDYPPVIAAQPPVAAPARRPVPRAAIAGAGGSGPANGIGEFDSSGAYVIRLGGHELPPAPWVNVLANPDGGCIVSESGSGPTWAENSFFYRLTPWNNDPVRDAPGECLYIRDEDSGEFWSPTPAPVRDGSAFTVRHAAGSTTFTLRRAGIHSELLVGMPERGAVRISCLTLTNTGDHARQLTVTLYAEWVLGTFREHARHHVRTGMDLPTQALLARNSFSAAFADLVGFAWAGEAVHSFTTDRREFIGRNRTLGNPAALKRERLSGSLGSVVDPCAAIQVAVTLAPGETRQINFLLGAARGEDAVREMIARLGPAASGRAEIARAVEAWERRLSVVTVRTPEPTFDLMINRWMLYQALACRMWGRSALYQSSGAFGFRDQLQDTTALLYSEPGLARAHIVRTSGRQFIEGDVQHWWHPQTGRGVRTRFSDDLVWLPWAVHRYVTVTGDHSVLDETTPFLEMRELRPDEHEIYDLPQVSEESGSVYEHCLRALRRACTEGAHGLPLIGSGDWNDGMNRVGIHGKGESVWLAWFLISTLRDFAGLCEVRGDRATAAGLHQQAGRYVAAVETSAWDGEWYRRAYYDSGAPIGSRESEEARIDSVAQSWAVISGAGDPVRARNAMNAVYRELVNTDERLIVLLTPPFDKTPEDPGYIRGYVPGVRENGAQYTHAALWVVQASAILGDGDRAFELYQMLNPATHARTPKEVDKYRVEPYVIAADVYTAEGHMGRGGWTWYTGSAAWMYRVGLESILGFDKRGDSLRLSPRVPLQWPEFSITYRHGDTTYEIVVRNGGGHDGGQVVELDGEQLEDGTIPLSSDGRTHSVVIQLGAEPAAVAG